jgi:outer membrane murein-binding lipoprotein Lpp
VSSREGLHGNAQAVLQLQRETQEMTLKRKSVASLCAALLVLGFAAGCSKKESTANATGGNSKSGSDSGSKSSGDSDSKSSGDSDSKSDGNGLPNFGNFEECLSASSAYFQIVAAPAMMLGGASKAEVDKMKKDLEDLKGKIPPELESDMEVVGEAYGAYLEALANNSSSDDVDKAFEKLENSDVKKAQENIDAYFKKNCG